MLHMHSVDKSDDGCVQNPSKKVLALGFVHEERGKKTRGYPLQTQDREPVFKKNIFENLNLKSGFKTMI